MERINRQELLPVLEELVRTAFFRYFKVNLYCDCPFWPDDSMCSSRDCSVCECEPHEVPPSWLAADQQACEGPNFCCKVLMQWLEIDLWHVLSMAQGNSIS